MALGHFSKLISTSYMKQLPRVYLSTCRVLQVEEVNPPSNEPPIPAYQEKFDEPLKIKRARLLYQSRKRGMLENGLVLSTFAAKFLNTMEGEILDQYDRLINLPTNDWDIYYWATGVRPTPLEFNNQVMNMLKEHVKNKDRESRIRQPDLTH
uniref:Succinate dehydrogenase assembly factor 2, mitochondrial n=1 Tax=Graphocephala atropunctata TaxID=36148 RepID=A0A1B6LCY7_9HEMI